MIENFFKRNITPNRLQKLYDTLIPKDKLTFLTEVLPYCAAKLSAQTLKINYENLSDNDLEAVYNRVMSGVSKSMLIENSNMKLPEAFKNIEDLEIWI